MCVDKSPGDIIGYGTFVLFLPVVLLRISVLSLRGETNKPFNKHAHAEARRLTGLG